MQESDIDYNHTFDQFTIVHGWLKQETEVERIAGDKA
jgi:hypothetical protein